VTQFAISTEIIDPYTLAQAMQHPVAGACVTFEGRVRDHNDGYGVQSLSYQVFHALAVKEGQKILTEAKEKFALIDAQAVHREGDLAIGACAVWVGVLAPHRTEAFAACRYIIDAIKHRLPIWKKEFYTDGRVEWVNCQHHDHTHDHSCSLNEQELYVRQTRLPEIGAEGQARLKAARVLVVGAGGLGSAALSVLAAAGIGVIGIVEHDRLEASNLHRQMLYSAEDVGKSKVGLAAVRLHALNPFVKIELHAVRATAENVQSLFASYDLVLDCTDNFTTKYLLNDAAILFSKPVIHASLHRFEGQMLMVDPSGEGCLRCFWPEPPAAGLVGDCAEIGVLGSIPAIFGALQAHQAIQHFLGLNKAAAETLFLFDVRSLTSRHIKRHRRDDCPLCGDKPSITQVSDFALSPYEITVQSDDTRDNLLRRYQWVDVREEEERYALPLPEAEHLPFSGLEDAPFSWPLDAPLLIICARGQRSRIAAQKLRAKGYMAYSLKDGIGQLPSSSMKRAG